MSHKTKVITTVFLSIIGLGVLTLGVVWNYPEWFFSYELPSEKLNFSEMRPPSLPELLDVEGRPLLYLAESPKRIYKSYHQISPFLRNFVVLAEDAKFFTHNGFDVDEIKNSVKKNIRSGGIKRGGSTITQQLAKNLFLDRKRSFLRKFFEVPWTLRIERDLSKQQILELYLNVIEWGPELYGVEAASRYFFNKSASTLSIGNALYLTMIIPNPHRFDIIEHPGQRDFIEKKRRAFVNRVASEKRISPEERVHYLEAPFGVITDPIQRSEFPPFDNEDGNNSFFDKVREELAGKIDSKRSQRSKLDRQLMQQIFKIQSIKVPEENIEDIYSGEEDDETFQSASSSDDHLSDQVRYLKIYRNGALKAFRKLSSGEDILIENYLENQIYDFRYDVNPPNKSELF